MLLVFLGNKDLFIYLFNAEVKTVITYCITVFTFESEQIYI